MSFFERGDIRLHYEVHGEGFPILLFAPGGMRSAISFWGNLPWNPIEALSSKFRVIAMDQRNAGESVAPVGADDGWATYTEDHLALLDHLGVEKCHALGCCIGGSYCLGLIDAAPHRVSRAVLLQPIGASSDNQSVFFDLFDGWTADLKKRLPDVDDETWINFRQRMFGGDFVYNVSRKMVSECQTPLLVMMGNDVYHPAAISKEIVDLAPNAELVERWKEGDAVPMATAKIETFLS